MSSILIPLSTYEQQGIAAWQAAVSTLLKEAAERRVWCFYGDLGAGKTTCIKALCHALGVKEHVTSPTFGLVHEYLSKEKKTIYHFDFYRLKNVQEAVNIGCEEYFNSGHYCFIEWPQLIQPLLPNHYVNLYFNSEPKGGRTIEAIYR